MGIVCLISVATRICSLGDCNNSTRTLLDQNSTLLVESKTDKLDQES